MTIAEVSGEPALLSAQPQSMRWRLTFPMFITAAYLAIAGPLIFTHLLWTDEAQAFLIARDSDSLSQLLINMRYEGHPPLWHLMLWVITRFTINPLGMQIPQLAMAGTTVYLVARYSPLPRLAVLLFPFGYFQLFEYGIISRNYQMIMLLALGTCLLWRHRRTAYLQLACLLALLSLTHVIGLIIAAALGATLLLDAVATRDGRAAIRKGPLRFGAAIGLALAAQWGSALLMKPPADSGFQENWVIDVKQDHVLRTLTALWDGLLPYPAVQLHFWDYHMLNQKPAAAVYGLLMAIGGLFMICQSWRAVVFYLAAMLGQLLFLHIKYFGFVRQHGGLFIALMAAVMIAWGIKPQLPRLPRVLPETPGRWRKVIRLIQRTALVVLLAVHVRGAAVACYFAWQAPLSDGHALAMAIQTNVRPGEFVTATAAFDVPVPAVYLPGQKFYFPALGRYGTFVIWNKTWRFRTPINDMQDFCDKAGKSILVIAYDVKQLPAGAIKLGSFRDGIYEYQFVELYRLVPGEKTATQADSRPADDGHRIGNSD